MPLDAEACQFISALGLIEDVFARVAHLAGTTGEAREGLSLLEIAQVFPAGQLQGSTLHPAAGAAPPPPPTPPVSFDPQPATPTITANNELTSHFMIVVLT